MAWQPRCENEQIIIDAVASRSKKKAGTKNYGKVSAFIKSVIAEYVRTALRLYIDTGDVWYIETVRMLIHIYLVKGASKTILRRYDYETNALVNYLLQDIVDTVGAEQDEMSRVIIDDMGAIMAADRKARAERLTDSVTAGYTHTSRQHKTG